MRTNLTLLALYASFASLNPVATIDLSRASAPFPTNTLHVKGCPAVYDSQKPHTNDACLPFKGTITVEGLQNTSDGIRALKTRITNGGSTPIKFPRAFERVANGVRQRFVSFAVYSPPGSLGILGRSLAFADDDTASSVVVVGPRERVVYLIGLDKKALQRAAKNVNTEGIQIQVRLELYSLGRLAGHSEEVSSTYGNPMESAPFTIPLGAIEQ